MSDFPQLKPKELAFAQLYYRSNIAQPDDNKKSGKQCAIEAGYSESCAASMSTKLLKSPAVKAYLKTQKTKLQKKFDWEVEEKLAMLKEIALDKSNEKTSDRITAIVVANKMQGHDAAPKAAVDEDGKPVTAVVFMPDNGRMQIAATNVQVNVGELNG